MIEGGFPSHDSHTLWMQYALKEAEQGLEAGEVPVGAVVVKNGRILGRGHNQIEQLQDPTAHAEMIAITAAVASLQSKWLDGCVLYVTLEPCAMCAGAIVLARIPHIVIGVKDPKSGACGSILNVVSEPHLNHRVTITTGILEEKCSGILKVFFGKLRKEKISNKS